MKHLAVTLIALAVSIPCMKADDGTKFYVHFTDGKQMELDFVDRPTISFNSQNALKIQSETMSMKVRPFKNVSKITFGNLSGITDAVDGEKTIKADRGNKVAFLGFTVGTQIMVTSINGIVCRSASIDNENRFEMSLDGLSKGVYIVTADKEICKLVVE